MDRPFLFFSFLIYDIDFCYPIVTTRPILRIGTAGSIFSSFSLIRRYFIDFRIFYLANRRFVSSDLPLRRWEKFKSFYASTKKKKEETIEGRLAIAPLRRSITSWKVVDRWLLARWRPSECLNTKIDIRGKLPGSIALSSAVTWSAISDKLTGKHGIDFSTAKLGFCGVSPPTLNRLPFGIPRARIGKGSKARSVINRCKRDRRQKRERETNHPAD